MYSGAHITVLGAELSGSLAHFGQSHAESMQRLRSERGATMTEYGLLLGFVAVVVFGGLALFGPAVVDLFTDTQTEFSSINNPPPAP